MTMRTALIAGALLSAVLGVPANSQPMSGTFTVQIVQNKRQGNRFVSRELGESVKGTSTQLGLEVVDAQFAPGDSLDKVLLKHGIQPDARSRRLVGELNPSLWDFGNIRADRTVKVPAATAHLERWGGPLNSGTKVRVESDHFVEALKIKDMFAKTGTVLNSNSDAFALLDRQGRVQLEQVERTRRTLERAGYESLLLTPDEVAGLEISEGLPTAYASVPDAYRQLAAHTAINTIDETFKTAQLRLTSNGSGNIPVEVRTCTAASCGRRWDSTKSCEENGDKCGYQVCYATLKQHAEAVKNLVQVASREGVAVPPLSLTCEPLGGYSSPSRETMSDATYMIWAVAQPSQQRASCIKPLRVYQNQVVDGVVSEPLNVEVDPAHFGSPACS